MRYCTGICWQSIPVHPNIRKWHCGAQRWWCRRQTGTDGCRGTCQVRHASRLPKFVNRTRHKDSLVESNCWPQITCWVSSSTSKDSSRVWTRRCVKAADMVSSAVPVRRQNLASSTAWALDLFLRLLTVWVGDFRTVTIFLELNVWQVQDTSQSAPNESLIFVAEAQGVHSVLGEIKQTTEPRGANNYGGAGLTVVATNHSLSSMVGTMVQPETER